VSAESSVDCPPITYSFCGNSFEFGRKDFYLITGFLFGKLPKKLTKNERESKKDKEKVVEPPKNKKKPVKSSKKKNKADEQSPKKMTTYNVYGFVWSLKDPNVIPRGISWSIIEKFHKWDCSRLFAQCHHDSIKTYSVGEVLVLDVEQEKNLICPMIDTADETSQLDLNIQSDDHAQDLNSAYQDMDKDSNIHCEEHVEEQNSMFQDMDKESNIHSHDTVKQQNSPNICKEHVLAEFDAIKATVDIIDKREGEVSTSCLEKELDIVKDRIVVLEKCFKLSIECFPSRSYILGKASGFIYAESQDKYSVSQLLQLVSNEKYGPVFDCTQLDVDTPIDWSLPNSNEQFSQSYICGFVGFNDMLDPRCKDHQLNDNVLIGLVKPGDMMCGEVNKYKDKLDKTLHGSFGFDDMLDPGSKDLVKPVDMMCGEDNISDDRLDEMVAGGIIIDRSTLQSSPPLNAMEYQEPKPTDKMDPRCKDQPLNDNVPKGLVKLDDMMSSEDNISDYKLDETVAGGVIVHRDTHLEPHQIDKVDAAAFFDVQLDRVQSPKNPSLINNVEDLSRPPNSHNRKVTLPAYFDNIYHLPTKTTHIFSWNKTGHSVEHDFYLTLLGCSTRGWLFDKPDDDWAIAGPYFYALVTWGEVPFWPANGVKCHVPWTEADWSRWASDRAQRLVEKMRLAFEAVIPTYLDECVVLKAKCISIENYKNLAISTDLDPTHVMLAYREHMVDYL
nr:hypothetical protein [Tanacetum cinerariifolium]